MSASAVDDVQIFTEESENPRPPSPPTIPSLLVAFILGLLHFLSKICVIVILIQYFIRKDILFGCILVAIIVISSGSVVALCMCIKEKTPDGINKFQMLLLICGFYTGYSYIKSVCTGFIYRKKLKCVKDYDELCKYFKEYIRYEEGAINCTILSIIWEIRYTCIVILSADLRYIINKTNESQILSYIYCVILFLIIFGTLYVLFLKSDYQSKLGVSRVIYCAIYLLSYLTTWSLILAINEELSCLLYILSALLYVFNNLDISRLVETMSSTEDFKSLLQYIKEISFIKFEAANLYAAKAIIFHFLEKCVVLGYIIIWKNAIIQDYQVYKIIFIFSIITSVILLIIRFVFSKYFTAENQQLMPKESNENINAEEATVEIPTICTLICLLLPGLFSAFDVISDFTAAGLYFYKQDFIYCAVTITIVLVSSYVVAVIMQIGSKKEITNKEKSITFAGFYPAYSKLKAFGHGVKIIKINEPGNEIFNKKMKKYVVHMKNGEFSNMIEKFTESKYQMQLQFYILLKQILNTEEPLISVVSKNYITLISLLTSLISIFAATYTSVKKQETSVGKHFIKIVLDVVFLYILTISDIILWTISSSLQPYTTGLYFMTSFVLYWYFVIKVGKYIERLKDFEKIKKTIRSLKHITLLKFDKTLYQLEGFIFISIENIIRIVIIFTSISITTIDYRFYFIISISIICTAFSIMWYIFLKYKIKIQNPIIENNTNIPTVTEEEENNINSATNRTTVTEEEANNINRATNLTTVTEEEANNINSVSINLENTDTKENMTTVAIKETQL